MDQGSVDPSGRAVHAARAARAVSDAGRVLVVLLAVDVVAALAWFAATVRLRSATGGELDALALEDLTLRFQAGQLAVLLAAALTGVVWLVWQWRVRVATEIVRPLSQLSRRRWWAVASWFVPFVSFVVPYREHVELWRATTDEPVVWTLSSRSAWLPWWWAAFVTWWLASNASPVGGDPAWQSVMLAVAVVAQLAGIVAAALAAIVVSQFGARIAARLLPLAGEHALVPSEPLGAHAALGAIAGALVLANVAIMTAPPSGRDDTAPQLAGAGSTAAGTGAAPRSTGGDDEQVLATLRGLYEAGDGQAALDALVPGSSPLIDEGTELMLDEILAKPLGEGEVDTVTVGDVPLTRVVTSTGQVWCARPDGLLLLDCQVARVHLEASASTGALEVYGASIEVYVDAVALVINAGVPAGSRLQAPEGLQLTSTTGLPTLTTSAFGSWHDPDGSTGEFDPTARVDVEAGRELLLGWDHVEPFMMGDRHRRSLMEDDYQLRWADHSVVLRSLGPPVWFTYGDGAPAGDATIRT